MTGSTGTSGSKQRSRRRQLCLGAACAVLMTVWASAFSTGVARAATDVVTNTNASGPGSLAATVAAATSGDEVTFAPGVTGTIDLDATIAVTQQSLSITGPGAGKLTIDGQGKRIFENPVSGRSLSLTGLTLTDAAAPAGDINGGAVLDQGTLDLTGVEVTDSSATSGGGVAATTLNVTDSSFSDDTATGAGAQSAGGAILAGHPTISGSSFHDNDALASYGLPGRGGAVYVYDAGTIVDSTFTENHAGGAGGAGASSGQGFGGAVANPSGLLEVDGSTFDANTAGGNGGSGANSGDGYGGAILIAYSTFKNDTFFGNSAGGSAGSGPESGLGAGGAINFVEGAEAKDVTIDGNTAGTGTGSAGGGIYEEDQGSEPVFQGSIIAGNTAGSASSNCAGKGLGSSGHNLEDDAAKSCGFDVVGDPKLGPLQDNGGPTETQALPASSPAVDVVPAASCPTKVDQRGLPRPDDGESFCDMGAFELQDPAAATTLTYTGPTSGDYRDQVTLSAKLLRTAGGAGVSGRTVTMSFGSVSCSATTDASGVASCSVTPVDSPAGSPYAITASFAGSPGYAAARDTSHSFTVTREETATAYTGPTVILAGHSVSLSGRLLEDGATAISGRSLMLSVDGRSCSGMTDAGGDASCTVTASGMLGPVSASASFDGDAFYLPSSSGARPAIQFAFPATGAFLIGDQTAAGGPGTAVAFFGYQWSAQNGVSGDPGGGSSLGSDDSGFYGYAGSVNGLPASTPPSSCSGNWSASETGSSSFGGGSGGPPAGVPSYMGVLVTSRVNGAGFLSYSGSFTRVVVVHVSGYSSNPGSGGTGKIVAGYC